jgi:small subunit ribosomal protein S1
MVSKPNYREFEGAPPPLDESWWEAVLAEEEASRIASSKSTNPAGQGSRSFGRSASSDSASMDWNKALEFYEQDLSVCLLVTGFNRGGLLVTGEDLQGFVPVSHLIDNPEQECEPEKWLKTYLNRSLQLKVIECDRDRGRVVFSERAALAEPGSRNTLLHRLTAGDCVHGTVTNITDFGVFVDLGGVEGLIHVSEISWGRVRHPADVVSLGEPVDVYVIQVDQERARVALSLKRLYPNPWLTAEQRYFPGQVTEAVVTSIVQFGAFARLEEGLDGLIHVSEICADKSLSNAGDILKEGQKVRVRVLHVDGSRQRLGLSLFLTEIE